MSSLARLLRGTFSYRVFLWMLDHLPFAIPLERLRETDTLLAFFHPAPDSPFHVLILPREQVVCFADLDPSSPFLADLVQVVQSLVQQYHLPAYRLIVNGGEYQQFPRLHFHLVSDQHPG